MRKFKYIAYEQALRNHLAAFCIVWVIFQNDCIQVWLFSQICIKVSVNRETKLGGLRHVTPIQVCLCTVEK